MTRHKTRLSYSCPQLKSMPSSSSNPESACLLHISTHLDGWQPPISDASYGALLWFYLPKYSSSMLHTSSRAHAYGVIWYPNEFLARLQRYLFSSPRYPEISHVYRHAPRLRSSRSNILIPQRLISLQRMLNMLLRWSYAWFGYHRPLLSQSISQYNGHFRQPTLAVLIRFFSTTHMVTLLLSFPVDITLERRVRAGTPQRSSNRCGCTS